MATLLLTEAPQYLTGSENGVVVKAHSALLYGFGATAPAQGILFQDVTDVLDYGGNYGKMWVWQDNSNIMQTVTYFAGA